MIDVAAGEYGHEFIDKMISLVDNGRCLGWKPYDENVAQKNYKNEKYSEMITDEFEEEINPKHLRARSTYWQQFWTLYKRRTLQMWRDSVKPFPLSINLFNRLQTEFTNFQFDFVELHEAASLHDVFSWLNCWWNIPRCRK